MRFLDYLEIKEKELLMLFYLKNIVSINNTLIYDVSNLNKIFFSENLEIWSIWKSKSILARKQAIRYQNLFFQLFFYFIEWA